MSHPRHARRLLAAVSLGLASTVIGCSQQPQELLGSARQFLQKSEPQAAIIQLKNVLQVQPGSAEARFLLGSALLDSGDAAGAQTELNKALELQYPQDLVQPALARALLAQNQSEQLVQHFSQMQLGSAAARADLQLSLAQAYAAQDQTERSEHALQAALQADPRYAPALLERARRLARQGQLAAALTQVSRVLELAPQNHEAWKFSGDLKARTEGQGEEALAAYRKAVALRPDYLAGHSALTLLLLQKAQPDAAASALQTVQQLAPNHPYTQYLAALLAYQKKDYKGAAELVQRSLRSVPNNLAALELAGACALQQQHFSQAQGYLARALEAAPTQTSARKLLVLTYLRMQQPAKAREAMLPALRQEPLDPSLYALAGEVFFRNGELARAEEFFSKARGRTPSDGKLRTKLALVELALHPAAEPAAQHPALDVLRDIAASDSGASADLALISALLQARDHEQALQAIAGLEKKQPKEPLAPYLRSRVELATGQSPAARASLQRALSLDAQYYPAVAAMASMDLAEQKPREARQRIEGFVQSHPKHAQALLALADLAARGGAPVAEVAKLLSNAVLANPDLVEARLLQVELYLGARDYKNATARAQEAVAALPDEPRLVDALGRSLQASGDSNQALASYRRLAQLMPQSALPYWRMADLQLAARDRNAAVQSLQKALGLQPDFLDGQRALLALYLQAKQQDAALELARTVQKQRPREDMGYVMEADIWAIGKHWDKATATLRSGMKQVSTTPMAMKLHTSLQASGQGAEAEQFAQGWQKDHPQDAAFLFYLGDAAMARKDYGRAEQFFAAVVQQQPDSPVALNNLAWATSRLKKDGAVALAEKAVALAPKDPNYLDTLATLQSEQGNYAKALEVQSRALALQPQNPMLKLNLAIIHLRAGKKELARKPLDELSALGNSFSGQARVQALQKDVARP